MLVRAPFAAVILAAVIVLMAPVDAQSTAPSATRMSVAPAPSLLPAPFNPPPPGSVFQFTKSKVVIGKVDGYFIHYTSNGKPRTTNLLSSMNQDYFTPDNLSEFGKIWPLIVGKTVRYHRYEPRGGSRSWADEVTIAGTDTLKIGEKSVEVYIVRGNSHGENRNNWEGTWTLWYAPSLGWLVKSQFSDNYGVRENDQVVDYELAK